MLRLQIGHESFRFTSNSPHEEQVHKWWHGARIQALCLSIQMTHSAFNIQHSGLLAEKKKNRVIIFLSTSIYDLVLLHVCHFHHHCLIVVQLSLSRYSCLHLGSLHPRIFLFESDFLVNNTPPCIMIMHLWKSWFHGIFVEKPVI